MVPCAGEKEWLRAPPVKEIRWMEQKAVCAPLKEIRWMEQKAMCWPHATGANRGADFFF